MKENTSRKIIPISETQAAIGAGAILSFFVIWALIAGVGDDFVCWIGGKNNLSGWVQGIGSIAAVCVAIWVPYKIEVDKDKKLQQERFESAVINLPFVIYKIESLIDRIEGYSKIIKQTGTLNSIGVLWGFRYIDAFMSNPLPESIDLDNLRYISFNDTVNLSIIVNSLCASRDALLNDRRLREESITCGGNDDVNYFVGNIEIINSSINSYKQHLTQLRINFDYCINNKMT